MLITLPARRSDCSSLQLDGQNDRRNDKASTVTLTHAQRAKFVDKITTCFCGSSKTMKLLRKIYTSHYSLVYMYMLTLCAQAKEIAIRLGVADFNASIGCLKICGESGEVHVRGVTVESWKERILRGYQPEDV